jgi:hypothetical protein
MALISVLNADNLYLIQGTPTNTFVHFYPTNLLKYDSDTKQIELINEITTDKEGSEFIRLYYDEKIIVISKIPKDKGTTEEIVIDMNNTENSKLLKYVYGSNYTNLYSYLLRIPDKGLYQTIYLSDLPNETLLLGINVITLETEYFPMSFIKNVILSGRSPISLPGSDTKGFMINDDLNLRTGGTDKNSIKDPIGIKLPEIAVKRVSNHISAQIVNEKIVVLVDSGKKPKNNQIGNKSLLVLNKTKDEWGKVSISGSQSGVTNFGNYWLGGYVQEDNKEQFFKNKIHINSKAYWRLVGQDIYAPGILFMYNTETKLYFEIITNDADSEILLIEDNDVYYRIYDEIYKAEIVDDKVAEGKLLVKNDIVSDIHWAFISK